MFLIPGENKCFNYLIKISDFHAMTSGWSILSEEQVMSFKSGDEMAAACNIPDAVINLTTQSSLLLA